MTLGAYLETKCFDLQNLEDILGHTKSYAHGSIRLTISVSQTPSTLTEGPVIVTWGCCRESGRQVTPVTVLSDRSLQYSFGKFLENCFYNDVVYCRTWAENKLSHRHVTRYFAKGQMVSRVSSRQDGISSPCHAVGCTLPI